MKLRRLGAADREEAYRMQAELGREGFGVLPPLLAEVPWKETLAQLEKWERGENLPPGRGAESVLVAEEEGVLVGRISVRHTLTPWLLRIGGHIGYAIRPAHRRQGYATQMLTQALPLAAELGLEKVLVTCDEGNIGSRKVIERNGGRLENIVREAGRPPKRRYWIPTTAASRESAEVSAPEVSAPEVSAPEVSAGSGQPARAE